MLTIGRGWLSLGDGMGFIQVGITGYFVKIDFVFTRDNTFLINHLKMFSTAIAILNSIYFPYWFLYFFIMYYNFD